MGVLLVAALFSCCFQSSLTVNLCLIHHSREPGRHRLETLSIGLISFGTSVEWHATGPCTPALIFIGLLWWSAVLECETLPWSLPEFLTYMPCQRERAINWRLLLYVWKGSTLTRHNSLHMKMTITYRRRLHSLTLTYAKAFLKGCLYDRQQYHCVLCTILLSLHWGHAATVFNYNSITLNPTMGEFSFVSHSMVRQMESWSSEPPLCVDAVWIKVGLVKASVYC